MPPVLLVEVLEDAVHEEIELLLLIDDGFTGYLDANVLENVESNLE